MAASRDPQAPITLTSVGTTVFTTFFSSPVTTTEPTVSSGAPQTYSTAVTPTNGGTFFSQTSAVLETLTSTFTTTFVLTGVSLETRTVSPGDNSFSPDELGATESAQQPTATSHGQDTILSPPPTTVTSSNPSIISDVASTITSNYAFPMTTTQQISSRSVIPPAGQTTSPSDQSSSDISNRGRLDESRNLAHILPAVFLPIAFVIALVYVVFHRYRRDPRLERLVPVPFINPVNTVSLSRGIGRSLFMRVGKKGMRHIQGPASTSAIALMSQSGSAGNELNGASSPVRQGQAVGYQPVPPGTTMPEPVVAPEIQAEILDIRARLADIESREPLAPPRYSPYIDQ